MRKLLNCAESNHKYGKMNRDQLANAKPGQNRLFHTKQDEVDSVKKRERGRFSDVGDETAKITPHNNIEINYKKNTNNNNICYAI